MSTPPKTRPPPSPDEIENARRVVTTAESAARHLLSEAAVVAAQLKEAAGNGHHEQLRVEIRAVGAEVSALRTSLHSVSDSVLGLQRNNLRLLGASSLVLAVLLSIAFKALGV